MLRKNLDLIIVGALLLALILFHETLELVEELGELILELLHTLFEWVEMGVDGVVEHMFHILDIGEFMEFLFTTERHGSQVVTFYILMSGLGYIGYHLAKFVPRIWAWLAHLALLAWIRRKTQVQLYWYSISALQKALVVVGGVTALYLASFLII